MEDKKIISLFWLRDEEAIVQTNIKYGAYCLCIARSILTDVGAAEECVNDTWLRAWSVIPPETPHVLSAFLGKITRNIALDRYRRQNAAKRCSVDIALHELEGCIPVHDNVSKSVDDAALTELLEDFLSRLSRDNRRVFLKRYWYLLPVKEIARDMGWGESRVKMSLMRTRKSLKLFLEKEDIHL